MQTNCPNCGAVMTGPKCEYCGTVFEKEWWTEEILTTADGEKIVISEERKPSFTMTSVERPGKEKATDLAEKLLALAEKQGVKAEQMVSSLWALSNVDHVKIHSSDRACPLLFAIDKRELSQKSEDWPVEYPALKEFLKNDSVLPGLTLPFQRKKRSILKKAKKEKRKNEKAGKKRSL